MCHIFVKFKDSVEVFDTHRGFMEIIISLSLSVDKVNFDIQYNQVKKLLCFTYIKRYS